MFKHRFLFLLGLVMVSGLSSCGNLYSASSSASSRGPTPGYYKEELKYSLADNPKWGVFGAINDMGHVPVGTPDVLILPVVFNDIDKEFDKTKIDFIHEAYTGENLEDNAFYSLKEFYSVSSYGKLDIDIHFADPFRTSMTTSEFETLFKLSPPAGVTLETDPIITIIDEYLDTISEAELAELDNDNNGYIDSVHLIYLTKDNADTNIWWHFTYGDFYKASKQRSKRPGIYFFSNYETGMDNGRYEGYPDSHTIIHEYGHTLGLADYYSYDDTMAMYAGAVDMMDLNIGDHTAYSKMMGWIDPYVVDGTKENFEITIKPFEESGDCIVMGNPSKDPFNDTVFDEYIILSYYTPTGINGRDAGGYAEWTGHGFNKLGGTYQNSGLQAFHVDSRTVYYILLATNSSKPTRTSSTTATTMRGWPLPIPLQGASGSKTGNPSSGKANCSTPPSARMGCSALDPAWAPSTNSTIPTSSSEWATNIRNLPDPRTSMTATPCPMISR